MNRVLRTVELIYFALRPRKLGAQPPYGAEAAARESYDAQGLLEVEPRALGGGIGPMTNSRGELKLFIPGCYALAATAVLFRLKREGFSACTVTIRDGGLLVQGRR
ncbi:hypothetical protein GMLC_10060 [Geomonas limicola]|uniref:Uncharacterized protein n=1 Tax=Geomonas limicola TaxID=2740186 RepID=A0A6V8N6H9_9BACT|nr:hypothetical protein [Geomonas limicola]GFO67427.1 hypothetical protein GMLC_10060 [Geomonas limicola]